MILLLILLAVAIPVSSAENINFDPASLSVSQGDTGVITLILDAAPKGLAGYMFQVTVTNPGTTRIMDVSYPPWAGLSHTTGTPGESIMMSAVDLQRVIEPGATNVILGTISVQGGTAGISTVSLGNIQLDADGGEAISAVAHTGTITVSTDGVPVTWTTAPTSVPVTTTTSITTTTSSSSSSSSSNGGSSGSSGGSSGGGTSGGTLASVTSSVTGASETESTSTVQATITTDVWTPLATQPVAASTAATPAPQLASPVKSTLPGGTGPAGIPWVFWAVVVVLVIISLVLLYLAVTKKI